MTKFKIEYDPTFSTYKYRISRMEYKWFGLRSYWYELQAFDSLEKAESELHEYKKFPKYYEV